MSLNEHFYTQNTVHYLYISSNSAGLNPKQSTASVKLYTTGSKVLRQTKNGSEQRERTTHSQFPLPFEPFLAY